MNIVTKQKALNEMAKKIGYEGDYMTEQTALNWIAENMDSGGGGGIIGVKSLYLDKNNPLSLILEKEDGTKDTVDLSVAYSSFIEEHKMYCYDFLDLDQTRPLWTAVCNLNQEMPIKFYGFGTKHGKKTTSGILLPFKDGVDECIRVPQPRMRINFEMRTHIVFAGFDENYLVSSGYRDSIFYVKVRRIGEKTWNNLTSKGYRWSEVAGQANFKSHILHSGTTLAFDTPDYPCEIKFTYKLTNYGDNPTVINGKNVMFGVRSHKENFEPGFMEETFVKILAKSSPKTNVTVEFK